MADNAYIGQRAFDKDENRTRVWDKKGNFMGYEAGNTENLGTGMPHAQADAIMPYAGTNPNGPPIVRDEKGAIDWKKSTGKWLEDLIPAAITAAAPELRVPGMANLTPLKQVVAKMGLSTALQTVVDQLVDKIKGGDKPLLNSAVGAAGNSFLGIGAPELTPGIGNVGIEFPGMSKGTTINRSNSGTSKISSTSRTESGPVMVPGPATPGVVLGPNGQPMVGAVPGTPQPTGQYLSNTTGGTTTGSSGVGSTDINREIATPGWAGHLLDLFKNIQSYKTNSTLKLTDQQRAIKSALLGLGFNVAADTEKQ